LKSPCPSSAYHGNRKITEWKKKEGEQVKKGEILLVVETEK